MNTPPQIRPPQGFPLAVKIREEGELGWPARGLGFPVSIVGVIRRLRKSRL